MKWGAPTYSNAHGQAVIYLYGGKDHANLGFVRGVELQDAEGVLRGRGESGRHVEIYPGKEFPDAILKALVKQCSAMK